MLAMHFALPNQTKSMSTFSRPAGPAFGGRNAISATGVNQLHFSCIHHNSFAGDLDQAERGGNGSGRAGRARLRQWNKAYSLVDSHLGRPSAVTTHSQGATSLMGAV
jgi:hypothetical protein